MHIRKFVLIGLLILLLPGVVSAGLVAGWMCNEASGNVHDFSSNNLTLTMTSGATFLAGKYGNACRFDGTDDHGDAGNVAALQAFGNGAISIMAWVFVNAVPALNFPAVVEKGVGDWSDSGATTTGFFLSVGHFTDATDILWTINDNTATSNRIHWDTAALTGTWTHVAAVAEPLGGSPVLRLYVNGTSVATTARTKGSINDVTNNLNVGRWRQFTRHLNGSVDSLMIFNHVVSQAEVDAHRLMRPRYR